MVSTKTVCEMAEALEGVTVKDHFGSDAYCANKRMFATVWHDRNEVNLRLSLEQQRHFLSLDGEGFVEIDNAWGRQGFTKVQLEFVNRKQFEKALKSAWEHSAIKTPAARSDKKKATKPARSKK
jgi:hypothetical protein